MIPFLMTITSLLPGGNMQHLHLSNYSCDQDVALYPLVFYIIHHAFMF